MPPDNPEDHKEEHSVYPASDSQNISANNSPPNSSEEQIGCDSRTRSSHHKDKKHFVNIIKIPKIDVIEGIEANRIAREANRISKISVIVNGVLAFFTLLVIVSSIIQAKSSVQSVKIADSSLRESRRYADSIAKAQKIIQTKTDIANAKKLGRDTDFINKQEAGIDSQISAIKETQNQFIISHSPYITVVKYELTTDNKIKIYLENQGTQMANIREQDVFIKADTPNRKFKNWAELFNWIPIVKRAPYNFNVLIQPATDGKFIAFDAPLDDISESDMKKINLGKYVFYIRIVIYYFNTATQKTMNLEIVNQYSKETEAIGNIYFSYKILKKYP